MDKTGLDGIGGTGQGGSGFSMVAQGGMGVLVVSGGIGGWAGKGREERVLEGFGCNSGCGRRG